MFRHQTHTAGMNVVNNRFFDSSSAWQRKKEKKGRWAHCRFTRGDASRRGIQKTTQQFLGKKKNQCGHRKKKTQWRRAKSPRHRKEVFTSFVPGEDQTRQLPTRARRGMSLGQCTRKEKKNGKDFLLWKKTLRSLPKKGGFVGSCW